MTADATGLMATGDRPRRTREERNPARDAARSHRWRVSRFVFIVAIVAAGALVWVVCFSSVLVISKVEVTGVSGIRVNRVLDAADVPIGLQMARLDTAQVRAGIETLPWVRAAAVVRSWPRGVVLVVEPREAAALLEGSQAALDPSGAVFVPPEPLEPGLPTVRGDGVGLVTAMRVLGTIPPELLSRVALASATTRDDVELILDSGIVIRWGSAERPLLKARVLKALMKTRARVYDVASPELPTTIGQPLAPTG